VQFYVRTDPERVLLLPHTEVTLDVTTTLGVPGEYAITVPLLASHRYAYVDHLTIYAKATGPRLRLHEAELDYGLIGVGETVVRTLAFTNESDVPAKFVLHPTVEVRIACMCWVVRCGDAYVCVYSVDGRACVTQCLWLEEATLLRRGLKSSRLEFSRTDPLFRFAGGRPEPRPAPPRDGPGREERRRAHQRARAAAVDGQEGQPQPPQQRQERAQVTPYLAPI
jgi:hypothetical protein